MMSRIWNAVRVPSKHEEAVGRQDRRRCRQRATYLVRMIDAMAENTIEQDAGKASGALDLIDANRIADDVSPRRSPALNLRINVENPDLGPSRRQPVGDFKRVRPHADAEHPQCSSLEDVRDDGLPHVDPIRKLRHGLVIKRTAQGPDASRYDLLRRRTRG